MTEFTHQGVLKQGKSPHFVLALNKSFGPGEVVPLTELGSRRFADQFDDIKPITQQTAVSSSAASDPAAAEAAAAEAEAAAAEAEAAAAEAEKKAKAEAAAKGKK